MFFDGYDSTANLRIMPRQDYKGSAPRQDGSLLSSSYLGCWGRRTATSYRLCDCIVSSRWAYATASYPNKGKREKEWQVEKGCLSCWGETVQGGHSIWFESDGSLRILALGRKVNCQPRQWDPKATWNSGWGCGGEGQWGWEHSGIEGFGWYFRTFRFYSNKTCFYWWKP